MIVGDSKMKQYNLLDCTLRDGAYIVDGQFGESAIRGIISKLQDAGIDIIECGWLKDSLHTSGSTFFHQPSDLQNYFLNKKSDVTYVAMIDWDRYDLSNLPRYDGKSIDAIRVVFPYSKFREGVAVGSEIQKKGYQVYYQAANTLAYKDSDLIELAKLVNEVRPEGLSIVDTFGAMYEEDLDRIVGVLDEHLVPDIKLGFHSHNNQQLAYANSMHFVKLLSNGDRKAVIDASLNGMGRGAGNATTELVANYLNTKCGCSYDLDSIMDAIDIYMDGFNRKYSWGYSTPYYIAGIYCCHVNNIAYLQNNHRTSYYDMRQIIESLDENDRKTYNYDLLEDKYIANQDRHVDDAADIARLKEECASKVLLVAPGKTSLTDINNIKEFIRKENPIVIAVNALLPEYDYDYLFVTNKARYEYARTTKTKQFDGVKKILLSNIKEQAGYNELIINYNRAIKRGWRYFDNAVICALRIMVDMGVEDIYIAGFDGFKNNYNESYADASLPTLNPEGNWDELNEEIKDMYHDVISNIKSSRITFITDSIFEGNR